MTKKDNKLHILIWNYCYYTDEFAKGGRSKLSLYNRDEVFEKKEFKVNINIKNAEKIKAFKLGKNNGSALHNWIKIGAPESPRKEQAQELIRSSVPSEIEYQKELILNPNEIVYIIAE